MVVVLASLKQEKQSEHDFLFFMERFDTLRASNSNLPNVSFLSVVVGIVVVVFSTPIC